MQVSQTPTHKNIFLNTTRVSEIVITINKLLIENKSFIVIETLMILAMCSDNI